MTPEMTFECLLVSHDPTVVCTLSRILQDFSIRTKVCPDPSRVAHALTEGDTDLIVIDFEDLDSSELMHQVCESRRGQKPTILAVSTVDCAVPGVHVVLRKPVTLGTGTQSVKDAYSKMVQDYRKHTRFAVMATVLASDENNETFSVTVTNIGEGGVGLTLKKPLATGSILSFRIPLPGSESEVYIQARVLWTRHYGIAGCEFVRIPPADLHILRTWLQSRYPASRAAALIPGVR